MTGNEAVFGYNFVDGRLKGYPKYKPQTGAANTMYFRLVRGSTAYGINNFVANGIVVHNSGKTLTTIKVLRHKYAKHQRILKTFIVAPVINFSKSHFKVLWQFAFLT